MNSKRNVGLYLAISGVLLLSGNHYGEAITLNNQLPVLMNRQLAEDASKTFSSFPETKNLTLGFKSGIKQQLIPIDEENFPDELFRDFLFQQEFGEDGLIDANEINDILQLTLDDLGIADLTGIQYFTNLMTLRAANNELSTHLDLSENINLSTVDVSGNQLPSINLSTLTKLENLNVSRNQLTGSLNISNNLKLNYVVAGFNKLTTLDTSGLNNLVSLSVKNNQLMALDLSNNPNLEELEANTNRIKTVNLTNNFKLTTVYLFENQLSEIDLTNNLALYRLNVHNNQLAAIDVRANTSLAYLYVGTNQLKELDLSKNHELLQVGLSHNKLTEIDVQHNLKLEHLFISENLLTKIDVTKNTKLKRFDCMNNRISGTLDVRNNPDLITLKFGNENTSVGNQVNQFLFTSLNQLEFLNCRYNQLTELETSTFASLRGLDCSKNELSKLDLTTNLNLEQLFCTNNHLTSLDLSKNAKLKASELKCGQQTSEAYVSRTNLEDLWTVDMNDLVGTENSAHVSVATMTNWNYDSKNGALSVESATNPRTVIYDFSASNGVLTTSLDVSLTLIARPSVELKPKQNLVLSNDIVEWEMTITDYFDGHTLENIQLAKLLPIESSEDTFDYQLNTTKIAGLPVNDQVWTKGTILTNKVADGATLQVTFETLMIGSVETVFEAMTKITSNLGEAEASNYVRIRNSDENYSEGDLALINVPKIFQFMKTKPSASEKKIKIDQSIYNTYSKENGVYVKIKDGRTKDANPWNLTVQMDEFTSADGQSKLTGSEVLLNKIALQEVIHPNTNNETIITPISTMKPQLLKENLAILGNAQAKRLLEAKAGEGIGTWRLQFLLSDIQLKTLANTGIAGNTYNTKITWTLTDGL